MSFLFILAVRFAAAFSGQVLPDPDGKNLSYRLYLASVDASASRDCPSTQEKRYATDFQRVYGKRIAALMAAHRARVGPDPDFVVTSSCRAYRVSVFEQDMRHRRAMKAFEPELRKLEREFGGP